METADLTHHISRRFNEDLEKVRNQVLQMGGFVEQQLHKAITALIEGDSRLGESVATDDYKVNGMELAIDEGSSRILAFRAPVAGDWSVIVTNTLPPCAKATAAWANPLPLKTTMSTDSPRRL